MSPISYATPIRELISESDLPVDFITTADASSASFLDRLYFTDSSVTVTNDGIGMLLELVVADEIVLSLPGLDAVAIVVGGGADKITRIRASFFLSDAGFRIRLDDIKLGLRFSSAILKPVAEDPSVPAPPYVQIETTGAIAMDERFNLSLEGFRDLSLPPAMIGNSGIIISAQTFKLDLSRTETLPEIVAAGFDESFVGVFLGKATVKFPEGWSALPDDLSFENCAIGSGGFTGKITANYYDEVSQTFTRPPSDLFGIPFRLKHVLLELRQNAFVQAEILGQVLLPFFDNWVEVEIGLDLGGGFHVRLADADDEGLKKIDTEAFSLTLDSIAFEVKDGLFVAKVSGNLQPLFGAAAGLKWPAFDVKELSIDSKGNVHLAGGWLELSKQQTLDFHGFKLEISKLGFGKTEDGGQFIGFSGGLKLVDGLSAGASVEGLRIVWYPDGRPISLTLKGCGIEFTVPEVLYFKGAVSYDDAEKRFTGDIKLHLFTPELLVDGTVVVGTAQGAQGSYTYFAIYLDADIPGGILLANTGLVINNIAGLFALQMEPNKKPDEAWYRLGGEKSWYHRDGAGVTDIVHKWGPQRGSVALGAGLTLATLDGYSFNGRFMLVLVFPGPLIFLQGSANLLKKRSENKEDALFRALAVFDGREETVLIGINAEYKTGKKGELFEIEAGAEAFYSFKDPSAWYIDLGKEPRGQRIHALFGRFVEVDAYFMLNAQRLALGAWFGYDRRWEVGPLSITLQAWADANARLSFRPPQFHGSLRIHGEVALEVFGFGLGLTVDAGIAADLSTPFHLIGDFSVKAELPWPLPDVEASLTLEWGIRPDPPPLPLPLQDVSIENLKSTAAWPLRRGELLLANNATPDGYLIDQMLTPFEPAPTVVIPVVPVDARVHLTFARAVHDVAKVGVNGQEPPEWETIGDPSHPGGQAQARYSLRSVVLAKKVGSVWTPVASAPHSATERALFGSWAALPAGPGGDPGRSAQTKLWLWNLDPFAFLRRSGSSWEDWFAASFPGYPCVPEPAAKEACFGFAALPPGATVESPWTHPSGQVTLSWDFGPATVGTRAGTVGEESRRVKTLCFGDVTARAGVQVRGKEPGRRFRIVLADPPQQGAPGAASIALREAATIDAKPTCLDLRVLAAGTVANPWNRDGVRFTVHGADGGLLPVGRIEHWESGALGFNSGFALDVDLPCPSSRVELLVTHRPPYRIVAFNATGAVVATHSPGGTGGSMTETLRLDGRAITRVALYASGSEKLLHQVCFVCDWPRGPYSWGYDDQGILHGPFVPDGHDLTIDVSLPQVVVASDGPFCLELVCVTPDLEAGALVRREEKIAHIREELSRWSDEAPVFEPDTEYRLEIRTRAELQGVRSWDVNEQAYFRTEGPPGLTRLAVPKGVDGSKPFVTGLEDLTRYVRATDPSTVPPAGEKPLLFRPFYRAYDLGVEFNETYVETLYRMDRRDLGFYLFTASNEPARDSLGRLLALTNRWGKAPALTLSESETYWITLIDAASCLPRKLDPQTFAHDSALAVTEPDRVLSPDTLYEARLVPLLFHETFVGVKPGDPPAGWYADDAGPGGPSQWRVMEVGTPPTWYVEQTSKIGSAVEPDRLGTVLQLADPPSADWTDVRVSVYVRSPAGGVVGVVFRQGGPGSWYRFSLNERVRRLVKATPAGVRVLAEDHFAWQRNRDYLLTVEAIGTSLRAYMDGEPVFAIEDADLTTGRIGLYTCQSPGARFTDLRVDDFRAGAPVVYRFQLATSLYANSYHHLHGFEDETWPGVVLGADAVAPLALAVDLPAFVPPTEAEARAFEDLAKLALGPALALQRSTRIEVTRLSRPGGGSVLLLRSPEPLPPERVELTLSRPPFRLAASARPRDLKLTEVAFGTLRPEEESVTVLVREAMAPTRHRIERREIPGPVVEPAGDPFLLLESFGDAGALARFEVVDQGTDGGPSQWSIEGGALIQTSGIQGGSEPALPGTQAVTRGPAWTDYRLAARLRSDVGSSVGLVFRWVDADNHYRLSVDANLRFRRLIRRAGGVVTILWEDAVRYTPGEPFRLEVEAVGPRLTGWLDGARLFEVTDSAHAAGRVGVYAWNDPTARCEEIEVRVPSLDARALLRDRFAAKDLTGWTLASEISVPLAQAAAMSLDGGTLRLQSLVALGGDPGFPGAYSLAGDPGWKDVIFRVRLRSKGGALGVVFRAQGLTSYYRFAMSRERGARQLVKKSAGGTVVLWQDKVAYEADRVYELTIAAAGGSLRGWLDGVPLFAVEDGDLPAGRVGLYAWSNPEARFSEVRVWLADRAFSGWRLDEPFDVLVPGRWSFLDETGASAPAPWKVEAGALRCVPDPIDWEEPGGGLNGNVFAIAVAGGEVFVGGDFTVAGQVPALRIAVWAGGTWSALGAGVNGIVRALAVDGDRVYVGGLFTQAGGVPAQSIAVWNRSKKTWSALGAGVSGTVRALAVDGARLYAGGLFPSAGGVGAANIAAWNKSARTWETLGGGINGWVLALAQRGGFLYAGGRFTQAGGKESSRVAFWNGKVWAAATGAINGAVTAVAVGEEGLYIGGAFSEAGGVAANRIARWTGTAWAPLGVGLDGSVEAIALAGNQVWVGGRFTQAGGAPASRIARWSRSARAWGPVGVGVENDVFALALDPDRFWTGGGFQTAGGVAARRIAALPLGGTRFAVLEEPVSEEFRLAVRLVPGADGAAAVVLRWQDSANHLAFWLDAERGSRRLVRMKQGKAEVLWEDAVRPEAGREHAMTIDASGGRLLGFVDGVELFDLEAGSAAGRVGLALRRSPRTRFREVRWSEPEWSCWHAFGDEEWLPAGTRVRVHAALPSAPASEAGLTLRSVALSGESGRLRLDSRGAELRLVQPDGTPGHARTFLPGTAYTPVSFDVLRKADGTGLFLIPRGNTDDAAGSLRLKLTYHRDRPEAGRRFSQAGDGNPERVTIDIP